MKIKKIETQKSTEYDIKGTNYNVTIYNLYSKTRNGFRHETWIDLYDDNFGKTNSYNKCCYLNRTWEYFTFESCISGAFEKLKNDFKKDKKMLTKITRIENTFIDRVKRGKDIKYQWVRA